MCGICGEFYFGKKGKVDSNRIQKMVKSLSHRGPDQTGYFINQEQFLGFGHCRLKVIDLITGDQPMMNEHGSIVIICNGEVYNFLELKEELKAKGHIFKSGSDTEVIIHLYEQEGIEGFSRLVGMFAFALWDEGGKKLILARDSAGIKPLFYFLDAEQLVFASELKALVKGIEKLPELNHNAIPEYLMLQYVPGPKTIFQGIKKLEPGAYLIVEDNQIKNGRFMDFESYLLEARPETEKKTIEKLRKQLEQSVKAQLIADVPLGAFLSGGIDSSTIVSIMSRHQEGKVKSFSVDFSALGGAEELNETFWSKFSAECFGTEHYQIRVSAKDTIECFEPVIEFLDEPIADPACLPTYLISKLARSQVTVVLSGEGGDELFGGYLRYRLERVSRMLKMGLFPSLIRLMEKNISRFPHSLRIGKALRAIAGKKPAERHLLWSAVFSPEQVKHLIESQKDFFEKLVKQFEGFFKGEDYLNNLLWADFCGWLADDLLVKVDRMSMAHSLEARVPYLDPRLIILAFSLPGSAKIGLFSGKKIFKKAVSGLAPDSIINRKKAGFTLPLGKWFQNELKGFLLESLSEKEIKKQGIFHPKPISELIQTHIAGREDYSLQLYSILLFHLWNNKINTWLD